MTLVARLAEQPEPAGLLLDVDGTLAPDRRPARRKRPSPRTHAPCSTELAARYALVACVSGRTEDDARRVVGADELVYIGEHGMGLDRRAEQWSEELDSLVEESGWEPERKNYSAAFHFRTADDESAAIASLRKVERRAVELGLRARWGRKVLEVLPPVDANKGTAVRALLAGARPPSRPLRRRRRHRPRGVPRPGRPGARRSGRGRLRRGADQLGREADVIVGGTEALVELLRAALEMHLTDEILAPIRARYGEPDAARVARARSPSGVRDRDVRPVRTHDVTLFILNGDRLALIRKHPFPPDVWRPPGGGVKPGEEFVEAVRREALEETGLRVELERYLVETRARFVHGRPCSTGARTCSRRPPGRGASSRAGHRRDRRGALGNAGGARGPAARAAARHGPRVLALPGGAARRGADSVVEVLARQQYGGRPTQAARRPRSCGRSRPRAAARSGRPASCGR